MAFDSLRGRVAFYRLALKKKTTELFESSIALALPIVVVNLVDSKAFLSPLVASSKRGR